MNENDIRNGMPADSLGLDGWRKPWSGTNGGSCLEAKELPGGRVALRQSTDPRGPALILQAEEIGAFIHGAKAGLADYLLPTGPTIGRLQHPLVIAPAPDNPPPAGPGVQAARRG